MTQASAVSQRRLTKLAERLETLPRKAFNIDGWAGNRNPHSYSRHDIPREALNAFGNNLKEDLDPEKAISCGTTACACGWATTIPSFRRRGFRMHIDKSDGTGIVEFEGEYGFAAAEKFFDLPNYELTAHFFSPDSYSKEYTTNDNAVSPKTVARRLRSYVKNPTRYLARHDLS